MSELPLKAFPEAVLVDAGVQEKLNTSADTESAAAFADLAGRVIFGEELKELATHRVLQEFASFRCSNL